MVLLIVIIIITWTLSKDHAWHEARKKYNPMLNASYANIIYAFSTHKEKDLLKAATNIIGTQITHIGKENIVKFDSNNYLCPMLNISFKNLILNNFTQSEKEYIINKKSYIDKNMTIDFKKEKTNFQNGYNKLLDLCQKQNTDKL